MYVFVHTHLYSTYFQVLYVYIIIIYSVYVHAHNYFTCIMYALFRILYIRVYIYKSKSSTQVYENGILSFEQEPLDLFPINYFHFVTSQSIAPFYANVDITGTGNVFYRQTADTNLLMRATNEIQSAFLASTNASIKNLLIVTWNDVGYYRNHTDKVCTYVCTYE